MRVYKTKRGPQMANEPHNHQNYWVYDETQPVDVSIEAEMEKLRKEYPHETEDFIRGVAKNMVETGKILWGRSHGFKKISHFTIYRDGQIKFEFDNDIQYSMEELEEMRRKAKSAKRRLVWTN